MYTDFQGISKPHLVLQPLLDALAVDNEVMTRSFTATCASQFLKTLCASATTSAAQNAAYTALCTSTVDALVASLVTQVPALPSSVDLSQKHAHMIAPSQQDLARHSMIINGQAGSQALLRTIAREFGDTLFDTDSEIPNLVVLNTLLGLHSSQLEPCRKSDSS